MGEVCRRRNGATGLGASVEIEGVAGCTCGIYEEMTRVMVGFRAVCERVAS